VTNTLTYWVSSYVAKKMKYCEYAPWHTHEQEKKQRSELNAISDRRGGRERERQLFQGSLTEGEGSVQLTSLY